MKERGVVFDLYGTLCVSTVPEKRIIEKFGLNPEIHESMVRAVCGYRFDNWKNYLDNIARVSGVKDVEGIKQILLSSVDKGMKGVHPNARNVLAELSGSYKIGLVSEADPLSDRIIKDIAGYFDAITFSYVIGLTKHTPEIYKLHLKKLGVKQACMIGNSLERDILMSRKAGFGKGVLIGKEKGDWTTVSDLSEVPEAIRSGKVW
jgi:FMN phosphatase YigB (HAD superfamily)